MAVSQHWELSLRIEKEEIGFKEAKDFKKQRCFSCAKTQNFAQRSPGEGTSNVALELEGGFRSAETGDGTFWQQGWPGASKSWSGHCVLASPWQSLLPLPGTGSTFRLCSWSLGWGGGGLQQDNSSVYCCNQRKRKPV